MVLFSLLSAVRAADTREHEQEKKLKRKTIIYLNCNFYYRIINLYAQYTHMRRIQIEVEFVCAIKPNDCNRCSVYEEKMQPRI